MTEKCDWVRWCQPLATSSCAKKRLIGRTLRSRAAAGNNVTSPSARWKEIVSFFFFHIFFSRISSYLILFIHPWSSFSFLFFFFSFFVMALEIRFGLMQVVLFCFGFGLKRLWCWWCILLFWFWRDGGSGIVSCVGGGECHGRMATIIGFPWSLAMRWWLWNGDWRRSSRECRSKWIAVPLVACDESTSHWLETVSSAGGMPTHLTVSLDSMQILVKCIIAARNPNSVAVAADARQPSRHFISHLFIFISLREYWE